MTWNLLQKRLYVMLYFSWVLAKPPNSTPVTTTLKPISNLLSKFHQNDYKLTYERSELLRSNAKLVDIHLRTFKFNRTTPVVNATFTTPLDMGYKVNIVLQVYRLSSNEYREFPIRFQVNFCEAVASQAFGLTRLAEFGNVGCPIQKGKKYYFYHFHPDGSKFPPMIPNGHYMAELQAVYDSQEVFVINNYGIVDRPIFIT